MRATSNNPATTRTDVLLSAGRRAKLDLSKMHRVILDKFRLNPEKNASTLDLRSLDRDAILCPLRSGIAEWKYHGNNDGTGRNREIFNNRIISIREIGVAVYRDESRAISDSKMLSKRRCSSANAWIRQSSRSPRRVLAIRGKNWMKYARGRVNSCGRHAELSHSRADTRSSDARFVYRLSEGSLRF